jgi:hypothetical protein
MRTLALLSLLLQCHLASAKVFENSYLNITLPDSWACSLSGDAWICLSNEPAIAKNAVIVITAKVAAPEDNLPAFLTQLKRSKMMNVGGTPTPSKVLSAQYRAAAGTQWVQAEQLGSEIPDFDTLYLATVKDRLSIQLSFSAERTHLAALRPVFEKSIQSLKLLNVNLAVANPTPIPAAVPGLDGPAPHQAKVQSGLKTVILLGLAVGLAALAIAAVYSPRRKKISHRKSRKNRPE